jgi:hypothetical protein
MAPSFSGVGRWWSSRCSPYTFIGVLDFYADVTPPRVTDTVELLRRLAGTPDLRVLTDVSTDRGKERRIADLGQQFGLTVERRIDLPAPLGRSYAILSLPRR